MEHLVVLGVEAGLQQEGIAGEGAIKVIEGEGRAGCLDGKDDIAVGAPHEGSKLLILIAITDDGICPTNEDLALDVVAVALGGSRHIALGHGLVERLGIADGDLTVGAAAEEQSDVGIGLHLVVNDDLSRCVGRDGDGGLPLEEVVVSLHVLGLADLREAFKRQLPLRQVRLSQQPSGIGPEGSRLPHVVDAADDNGLLPVVILDAHVAALARPCRIVTGHADAYGAVALVFHTFPARVGIEDRCGFVYGMKEETGAISHVGGRPVGTFIPDNGLQGVVACVKIRCKVYFLTVPVLQVAAGRTDGDHLPVDGQLVTVVAGNADTVRARRLWLAATNVYGLLEIVNAITFSARSRYGYPTFFGTGKLSRGS